MTFINVKDTRINLDNIVSYYIDKNRLCFESNNERVFSFSFSSAEEVLAAIKILDQKCQVKILC